MRLRVATLGVLACCLLALADSGPWEVPVPDVDDELTVAPDESELLIAELAQEDETLAAEDAQLEPQEAELRAQLEGLMAQMKYVQQKRAELADRRKAVAARKDEAARPRQDQPGAGGKGQKECASLRWNGNGECFEVHAL